LRRKYGPALQHAWAELTHDRNYNFSGTLPRPFERQLFLYAGKLEIADKSFSELSVKIDAYMTKVEDDTLQGKLSIEIKSVDLAIFVDRLTNDIKYHLWSISNKNYLTELIG
jgi:hypothetical protein